MYRRILLLTFTIVGATSVIAQTLFIRELTQIFYGNELCLGVIFSGWLFFTGIGSIVARKIKKNIFLELQTILPLILIGEFFLVHSIKPLLNIGAGELISPVPMICISFTIFAPLALILGLLFIQGCKWWADVSKNDIEGVSKVYILDAIGDMTGGFLFAYLFIRLFSLTTLLIVGILNLIFVFILLSGRKQTCLSPTAKANTQVRPYKLRFIIFMLIGFNILGISFSKKIEKFSMKCDYPKQEIINYKRSLYGNLVLVRTNELYSLYESGILSSTYPTPLRAEETVHFPALQVKKMKQVLLLGGDIELLNEVLKYEVESVQWVKLNEKIIEVCKPYINFEILKDPRVQVNWEDERRFIKNYGKNTSWYVPTTKDERESPDPHKFDLVLISVGEPSTSLINRFYTYEFFDELKRIVNPDGVVALSVSSNSNYLSDELKEYNGTIYKTLKKIFPEIVLLPGDELKLFASKKSEWLSEDPEILSSRLKVPTKYVTKYSIPYEFYEERINWLHNILDNFTPRMLNRDWHPISYYYDTMVKTSYFSQPFNKMLKGFSRIPKWLMLLILILIFIGIGSIVRAPVLSIGILGGSGISSQILLILSFEVLQGYMYHKIGIITGGFMLGVAGGAKLAKNKNSKLSIIVLSVILYLGILSLIIWGSRFTIHDSRFITLSSESIFYILPILGGLLTGCAWTFANRELIQKGESVRQASGLLNGVDLFGSCVGSFFISIFFIPIYGFYFSLLVLVCLNFVALSFLLKRHH